MLASCFGLLATTHLVSVIVLSVLGSAPAQYYTEAAYLGGWSLVLVSSPPLHPLNDLDASLGMEPEHL